jgi:hypothetical protein
MTTVRTLVVGGYNRSTLNDAGKIATDAELVAHVNRVYQRMWSLIARARPDQYNAVGTLTLSGSPPQATLPSGMLDLQDVTDADGAQVQVIPASERNRLWNLAPCVYRVGVLLKSRAETGDPASGDVLTLVYLDQPADLTTLDSTLDARWPQRHDQLLVDYLALYLAVKDAGRSGSDRSSIAGELQQDIAAFAAEYQVAPSDLGWLHADAERAASSGVAS